MTKKGVDRRVGVHMRLAPDLRDRVGVHMRLAPDLRDRVDAAARRYGRTRTAEIELRLTNSFHEDLMREIAQKVETMLTVHLDGVRDGILAQSHVLSALTQESLLLRSRIEELIRAIGGAIDETPPPWVATIER